MFLKGFIHTENKYYYYTVNSTEKNYLNIIFTVIGTVKHRLFFKIRLTYILINKMNPLSRSVRDPTGHSFSPIVLCQCVKALGYSAHSGTFTNIGQRNTHVSGHITRVAHYEL